MNFLHGRIVTSPQERDTVLHSLNESVLRALKAGAPDIETVLNACDSLSKIIGDGHIDLLKTAGIRHEEAVAYVSTAKVMLQKSSLLLRLKTELGDMFSLDGRPRITNIDGMQIKETLAPLGVLLHIVAGNQSGLAFYSVLEGLLTGNINVVKLPGNDDGLSVMIFAELCKMQPRLAEYAYFFDYPSQDAGAIRQLTKAADAIVVWGTDQAIRAIRSMTDPDTRIIEWGHKLSFAYVTRAGITEPLLKCLAKNVIQTNQLLCSSCQGIYLDTDSMEDVYHFCERFLPVLEQSRREYAEALPIEIQAQTGLLVYTERLKTDNPCRVFAGEQTALLAKEDHQLELSILYGNCWVKRLPKEKIQNVLRAHKSHLQTAGLLCAEDERSALTRSLWDAGLVRVTYGVNMSGTYLGEAHDGEYPLRRYTKLVSELGAHDPREL